jgi:hypothetical protein
MTALLWFHLVEKARSLVFPVNELIVVDHDKPYWAPDQASPK